MRSQSICLQCGLSFVSMRSSPHKFCTHECHTAWVRSGFADRFWGKLNKNAAPPTHLPELGPCWEWTLSRGGSGYGHITRLGVQTTPHRVAWQLAYGPIPDGMLVLHKCDNRVCARPPHLFLGSYQDNANDMKQKGRAATGQKNGTNTRPERRATGDRSPIRRHPEIIRYGCDNSNAVFTETEVINIRVALASGRQATLIATDYGVHVATIYRIKHAHTYMIRE